MTLLDKIERKIGRYAPKNLMLVIIVGKSLVWLLDFIVWQRAGVGITHFLEFNRALIMQGQVWRAVSFLFVPEATSLFGFVVTMYFDWLIGSSLERIWGSFRFDLYYLCGVIGAIISGFIMGYTTNSFLNSSLFLAYALLFPDERVLLFFIIPIKMKWLAILEVINIVLYCIFGGWIIRLAIVFSLLNLILFVWRIPFDNIKAWRRRRQWKKATRRPNDDDYPFDL